MIIVSLIEDPAGNVIGVRYEDETNEPFPQSNQPTRAALEAEPGTVLEAAARILAE